MKQQKSDSKTFQGPSFVVISALLFATYGIWSKLMANYFDEFNQAWTRGILLLAILIPLGLFTKQFKLIAKKDIKWFVIISLCGGLNQAPYFYGFKHLPVGTATLLFYSMLVLGTFIIGRLFFREKITPVKYIALGTAILGLGIIYRFTLSTEQIIPALCTMGAGLMGAMFVVFSKKISSLYTETYILTIALIFVTVINFSISMVMHEILIPAIGNPVWLAQLGYSLCYILANISVVAGFKYLEPSIGGLLGLLEVVFAAIFGIILFHEAITVQLCIGSSLILFAASLPDLVILLKHKK